MISADRLKEMALEDIEKNPEKHLEEYVELSQQVNQLKIRNEELKKQYNCYACDTCKGKEDYIRLKIHCENAIKALHNKQAEYDKLKAENEILEKVNKSNQEKIKKLNETLEEEFIAKQYGNEALFFTLMNIKEIAEPYKKEIKKICGNCDNYDDCHACCKFDLNCYQYKKGDTTACEKFIMPWKYYVNELANKILQEISEYEGTK